ncbi:MAG: hypothetical protein FGM15_09625 [Chthoniobacterales bacterium]|nr:hypothetical protein [Chthoniobacterales bacterium]
MRKRVWVAIVLTLMLLCALGGSLLLVVITPFLFDDPYAADLKATWIMAGAVLSLPVMCLLAIAGVWIAAFPAGRSRWWYAVLALPLLSLLVFRVAGSYRPGFF